MRGAFLLAVMLSAPPALAQSPDISARRLLAGWHAPDAPTHLLAEVIAAAFASGLTWAAQHGGKAVYCPPAGLKGGEVMRGLERFVADHPDAAERTYGDPLASLAGAFPCRGK